MSKPIKYTWLSVHLFYNEPWEEFLQRAIEPYVNTAIQTGIAHNYFFVRYWELGPHIRLRLKGEKDMVDTILKPNLEEHFLHYFDSKPSRRIDPPYPENFSNELKWMPNNSIHYSDYIPEYNRFGGDVGILLCEEQFMVSSKTILEMINRKGRSWSYDDAMGSAIKLHLAFIHSAGLSMEKAIQFFEFFTQNWLPYTFQEKQENTQEDYQRHQTELSIEAFENSFKSQKENLIPFHQAIWEALDSDNEFEEAILNYWVSKNKSILQQINEAYSSGKLTSRTKDHSYPIPPENENVLLWSIFADLIHLTNNRLGILNRDESYLTFMMKKCLENIKKNEHLTSKISNKNSIN